MVVIMSTDRDRFVADDMRRGPVIPVGMIRGRSIVSVVMSADRDLIAGHEGGMPIAVTVIPAVRRHAVDPAGLVGVGGGGGGGGIRELVAGGETMHGRPGIKTVLGIIGVGGGVFSELVAGLENMFGRPVIITGFGKIGVGGGVFRELVAGHEIMIGCPAVKTVCPIISVGDIVGIRELVAGHEIMIGFPVKEAVLRMIGVGGDIDHDLVAVCEGMSLVKTVRPHQVVPSGHEHVCRAVDLNAVAAVEVMDRSVTVIPAVRRHAVGIMGLVGVSDGVIRELVAAGENMFRGAAEPAGVEIGIMRAVDDRFVIGRKSMTVCVVIPVRVVISRVVVGIGRGIVYRDLVAGREGCMKRSVIVVPAVRRHAVDLLGLVGVSGGVFRELVAAVEFIMQHSPVIETVFAVVGIGGGVDDELFAGNIGIRSGSPVVPAGCAVVRIGRAGGGIRELVAVGKGVNHVAGIFPLTVMIGVFFAVNRDRIAFREGIMFRGPVVPAGCIVVGEERIADHGRTDEVQGAVGDINAAAAVSHAAVHHHPVQSESRVLAGNLDHAAEVRIGFGGALAGLTVRIVVVGDIAAQQGDVFVMRAIGIKGEIAVHHVEHPEPSHIAVIVLRHFESQRDRPERIVFRGIVNKRFEGRIRDRHAVVIRRGDRAGHQPEGKVVSEPVLQGLVDPQRIVIGGGQQGRAVRRHTVNVGIAHVEGVAVLDQRIVEDDLGAEMEFFRDHRSGRIFAVDFGIHRIIEFLEFPGQLDRLAQRNIAVIRVHSVVGGPDDRTGEIFARNGEGPVIAGGLRIVIRPGGHAVQDADGRQIVEE